MSAAEQPQSHKNNFPWVRGLLLAGAVLIAFELLPTEAVASTIQGDPLILQIPELPPIDSIPLTTAGVNAELASLEHAQESVQSFYDKYVFVAPAHDPDLAKLKHAIDFYHTEHDKLLHMKAQIVQQEYVEQHQLYSAQHRLARAGHIRDELTDIAAHESFTATHSSLKDIETFVSHAKPGSVLYTDTAGKFGLKGARFWYPLEGGTTPSGVKLPALIEFKEAHASRLPLSTSRALYELQLSLKDRLTIDTPLGDLENPNGRAFVTAGAFDSYKLHAGDGGHSDLSAVDIRAIDKSPKGVAEFLVSANKIAHSHIWFEIPGDKENPHDIAKLKDFQEKVIVELGHQGINRDAAQDLIEQHSRLVKHATLEHYHFDTDPRPPILAPNSLVASK